MSPGGSQGHGRLQIWNLAASWELRELGAASCLGMAPHSFSLISLKGVGAYPEPCLVFVGWRHVLPS